MSLNEQRIQKALQGFRPGLRKANVRAYSKKVRYRNRDPSEEEVIRIYVEEKLDLDALSAADIIPDSIDGIPTDVEAIGFPVAANTPDPLTPPLNMKSYFDPLICGCSIGNIKITAGTLGYYFTKIGGSKVYLGSNAHVFSETIRPVALEKRIVQPGSKDGGNLPVAATLIEHTPLWRPLNPFNALFMVLANLFYQLIGQDPPYDMTDSQPRHLDFAVADPKRAYDMVVAGLSDWDDFCGIGFATSGLRSWFCKAKYITQFGYTPVDVNVKEAVDGDTVYKGHSRSTPRGSVPVMDDSMFLWVNYGGWGNDRPFDDVVMMDKILDPGDSGVAMWLTATFY